MEQRVIQQVFNSVALIMLSADCTKVLLRYERKSGWRQLPIAAVSEIDVARCTEALMRRSERIGIIDTVSFWHLPEATQQWQHNSEYGLASNTRAFFFGCLPENPELSICKQHYWKMVPLKQVFSDCMVSRGIAVRGERRIEWVGGSQKAVSPYHVLGIIQALSAVRRMLTGKENEAKVFFRMLAELECRGTTLDAFAQRLQRWIDR